MTRTRVSATVDSGVALAIDKLHEKRVQDAQKTGKKEPVYSHTVEDVLKAGVNRLALRNG